MRAMLFVRHGKSESNTSHTLTSRIEGYNLVEEGIVQARAVAREIAEAVHVDALYASPVVRALQTARIIGESCKTELQVDKRLSERYMGSLDGVKFKTHDEMVRAQMHEIEAGCKNGMETWKELQKRMAGFSDSVSDGITIAVSHSDPIVAMIGTIDSRYDDFYTEPIQYCSITAIDMLENRILCIGSSRVPDSLKNR